MLKVRESFEASVNTYDSVANLQREVLKDAVKTLSHYIQFGDIISDLGCGTGALTHYLSPERYSLIGCDLAHAMCTKANLNGEKCIQSDVSKLALRENSVDAVISSLCVQWVENKEVVLREINRVLKPGGHAVITSFTENSLMELRTAFAAIDSAPHTSHFESIEDWKNLVKESPCEAIAISHKEIREVHDTVKDIARQLKLLGANNKHSLRNKGLMTPRQWQKLERVYPVIDGKKQVTWEVVMITLRKS